MSRDLQRQRIDDARRAGTRGRLVGDRIPASWLDAWLDAWQRAHDWIGAEQAAGRRP